MGTVSDKLTYLNGTKTALKDSINLMGANITNDTFRSYPDKVKTGLLDIMNNGTDTVWNNWEKVSASDVTEATLNNTIQAPIKITLKGNTTQANRILPEGYTQVEYIQSHGTEYIDTKINADSNLRLVLDMTYDDPTASNQNIGAINMGGGQLRYHILPQNSQIRIYIQNTTYAVNTITIDTNRHLYDIDVPNRKIAVDNNEYSLNNENFDTHLNFWLFGRNSDSTIYKSKNKVYKCKMYVSGVLVRDYIPCYRNSDNEVGLYDIVNNLFYTNDGDGTFSYGAIASIPNPEFPQEIKVVTGNNVIKHVGKNFIPTNEENWEQGTINSSTGNTEDSSTRIRTADFVKVKALTDYYISANNDGSYVILNILVYDKSKNFLANYYNINSKINGTSGLKVVFPEGTAYVKVTIRKTNNSNLLPSEIHTAKPMLEENVSATSYEPYKEKTYQLNLGNIELCKIGNYQDVLFKNVVGDENYNAELESGVWYKKNVIEKLVLDGTWSNTQIDTKSTNTSRMYYTGVQSHNAVSINNVPQYSDKLTCASINTIDIEGMYAGSNGTTVVRLNKSRAGTTKESFNQYLSENNIAVYYAIQTSFDTQITDTTLIEQLETIANAKSSNTQTNISQTNADLPFILDVTALKSEV